jgi:predicted regulator of amino acid metabolism with ACT domain
MKIEISSKEIAKILNTPQNIVDAHIQNMMNEVHGSSKYLEELKKLQKPEKGCYYLDFQNVLNLTCMFDDPKLRRRIIQEVERKSMRIRPESECYPVNFEEIPLLFQCFIDFYF